MILVSTTTKYQYKRGLILQLLFFTDTKLTSFQRQLNLYGFRRITKGDDHGAYFHPNFQRGRKDLVTNIRRLPVKASHCAVTDAFPNESESSSR